MRSSVHRWSVLLNYQQYSPTKVTRVERDLLYVMTMVFGTSVFFVQTFVWGLKYVFSDVERKIDMANVCMEVGIAPPEWWVKHENCWECAQKIVIGLVCVCGMCAPCVAFRREFVAHLHICMYGCIGHVIYMYLTMDKLWNSGSVASILEERLIHQSEIFEEFTRNALTLFIRISRKLRHGIACKNWNFWSITKKLVWPQCGYGRRG